MLPQYNFFVKEERVDIFKAFINLSNTLPIKVFYQAVIFAFKGAQYDFF